MQESSEQSELTISSLKENFARAPRLLSLTDDALMALIELTEKLDRRTADQIAGLAGEINSVEERHGDRITKNDSSIDDLLQVVERLTHATDARFVKLEQRLEQLRMQVEFNQLRLNKLDDETPSKERVDTIDQHLTTLEDIILNQSTDAAQLSLGGRITQIRDDIENRRSALEVRAALSAMVILVATHVKQEDMSADEQESYEHALTSDSACQSGKESGANA